MSEENRDVVQHKDIHSAPEQKQAAADPTRRDMLFHLGVGLTTAATVLLAIPLVGFVCSGFLVGRVNAWISLGPLEAFPENTTRLATYRNPFTRPWDGQPQTSLAGCGDLLVITFRCLLLTVRILVALYAGFPSLVYLCARVTAVSTTKMVLALLDHLRADCSNIAIKSIMASFGFGAGKCPRLQILFNG